MRCPTQFSLSRKARRYERDKALPAGAPVFRLRVICAVAASAFIPMTLLGRWPHVALPQPARSGRTVNLAISGTARAKAIEHYRKLPLSFEPNLGQFDKKVRFLAHDGGYTVFLTEQEAVLSLVRPNPLVSLSRRARYMRNRRHQRITAISTLRMQWQGASPAPKVAGSNELPGKNNYFIGNQPKNWRTGVPTYGKVNYREVYPGIDLVFYGNQRQLECDFVVAPGADSKRIAFSVLGAERMQVDGHGDLRVNVSGGEMILRKPVIYQEQQGSRQEIAGQYTLAGSQTVRFLVGDYDHTKPLVIDPAVDYSTYLGGSTIDYVNSIAIDSGGNAYVTGPTESSDFPTTTNAVQVVHPGPISPDNAAVFVTEIDPTGTSALYSTYIGGNNLENAYSIAVDSASPPNVYITGFTCSTDFPTTPNAYLATFSPPVCDGVRGGAPFVTEFNPAGSGSSALVYSTYLAGTGGDISYALALDPGGNIYVTGFTYSTDFPTTPGALQSANNGASNLVENAFISRIDPNQSGSASLVASTYLGGTGNAAMQAGDDADGIAVDNENNVYVTGFTWSSDFPTTASALMQTAPAGVSSGTGFVTRLATTLGTGSLIYSTYLGGSGGDWGGWVSLGPGNQAYITGGTFSSDFPVTAGAYRTTAPSMIATLGTAFVSLIDTSQSGGDSLIYSTFFGGSNSDYGAAITADSSGNAYVVGGTFSSDFPVTPGAFQSAMTGSCSGFVSELMPLGNGAADLVYSTYYDGTVSGIICNTTGYFGGSDVKVDASGSAYMAGVTTSADFPVVPSNAYQTTLNGTVDGYVAKLPMTPKVLPTPSISSLSVNSGGAGTSVTISGSNFGRNQGASAVTFGAAAAPVLSWSSASIVVQVPSNGTPGVVQIAVQTGIANSNSVSFTVEPAITSVSPTSASVGALVTINGSNLGSGSGTTNNTPAVSAGDSNRNSSQESEEGSVIINGADAPVVSWSNTRIVAEVPKRAFPGPGFIRVTVQGLTTNSIPFTVAEKKGRRHGPKCKKCGSAAEGHALPGRGGL